MTGNTTPNDFGKWLTYYRNRSISENGKALSQFKLAEAMCDIEGIAVSRNHIYKWENGKSQIQPADRNVLLAIIQVLVQYKGIAALAEANQLINAAGLKDLGRNEIKLVNLTDPVQTFVEETITESSKLPLAEKSPNPYNANSSNIINQTESPKRSIGKSGGGRQPDDPLNFSRGDIFFNHPTEYSNGIETSRFVQEKRASYEPGNLLPHTGLAPSLPSIFVGRGNDLQELKIRLEVTETSQRQNIQVLTAMRGWPGVGKTTTAAALAYEPDVIQKYPDGVLWISLGPKPDILANLIAWCKALGLNDMHRAKNIPQIKASLAAYLRDKRMLLIIDDVWDADDASPFELGGYGCAILATTRLPAIAAKMVASPDQIYLLQVLSDADALELMRKLAPEIVAKHQANIETLIKNLEGLPLALQVAGRLLQTEHSAGFGVEELIGEISIGKRLLNEKVPIGQESLTNATTPSIAALLYKSIDHLDAKTRGYYAQLGVVAPSPARFDLNYLGEIWKVTHPKPIVKCLVDRGLLEYMPQSGLYQMHSLLVMLASSLWYGDEAKRLSTKMD
jgi:hypothetical protein